MDFLISPFSSSGKLRIRKLKQFAEHLIANKSQSKDLNPSSKNPELCYYYKEEKKQTNPEVK